MEISSGSTQADSVFCNGWDCATDESHCGSYTTVQVKILVYFQNFSYYENHSTVSTSQIEKKKEETIDITVWIGALQRIVIWHWSSCLNKRFEEIWMSADHLENSKRSCEPNGSIQNEIDRFFFSLLTISLIKTDLPSTKFPFRNQLSSTSSSW